MSLKHAGVPALIAHVRASFWIVGLRRLAKQVKRGCIPCQRHDARACERPCAPLPAARVTESPPFSVTGLDYAGPLFCEDRPRKKLYVLLFTCAVVRAVHLELTDSLSLEDFLLAFRRFTARRGTPSVLYSDNAQTFKGADVLLVRNLGLSAPKWRFIPPGSPWWGGWWERLVGSVKSGLRKSVGRSSLSRVELETLLQEIEVCINSRPLTCAGDAADCEVALSPSHFLLGKVASYPIPLQQLPEESLSGQQLRSLRGNQEQLLSVFWLKWSSDYLKSLPPIVSRFRSRGPLKVGSLVLIREDHLPRLKWPLGVVIEVFPGRDRLIRLVKVRMAKGEFLKPIQHLYCLEVSLSGDPGSVDPPPGESHILSPSADPEPLSSDQTRRSGRSIRRPAKLDL